LPRPLVDNYAIGECRQGSSQPREATHAFVQNFKEEGLALPDEIVSLYGAFDGFNLNAAAAPVVPVFAMLEAGAMDIYDAEGGYPRRVAVFQGGDEVHISVYRDRKKSWWCSYEYEFEPIGKRELDVPGLLEFGLQRAEAEEEGMLDGNGTLSWETYFQVR
jgi:hypothetical protein